MTAASFEFEEVGQWSEIKLEILEKYGAAYAKILGATRLKKFYIDGFSGAGRHLSKQSGQEIEGSPARALRISPRFDRYYFIDMNPQKTAYLQRLCDGRSDVSIHTGDCNAHLTNEVLPKIKFELYNRALCLLDPYGLHLDWEVMLQAGQSKAIDIFLNIVEAFQKRLKDVAGFKFVPDPLPMRNSNNAVVYYLFFASQQPVAEDIITDIFKKYRD